jgi:iron complex transport system permease protein
MAVPMRPLTIRRVLGYCLILAAAALVVVLIALKLGAVPVSLYGLGRDLVRVALGNRSELSSEYRMIVFDLRLPRIVLGLLVGAALSVAGTSFQALLRNPLADPYILGVSSGAAVGAILSLMLAPFLNLPPSVAALLTPLGAFLGALGTIVAVYFLGRREGHLNSPTLLLAGVISASFLSAVIMFLMSTLSGGNLRGMAFWLMGDLSSSAPWKLVGFLAVGILIAAGAIYTTAADLNLLLAGEQEAMHLGVDIRHVRLVVYIAASVLTGLAVSFGGTIGYVGLLVPHAMRLLFGPDHRILLPTAALGGAIAVVVADTVARTVAAPKELPIGAVTAIVGAPFFIYLLRRRLA